MTKTEPISLSIKPVLQYFTSHSRLKTWSHFHLFPTFSQQFYGSKWSKITESNSFSLTYYFMSSQSSQTLTILRNVQLFSLHCNPLHTTYSKPFLIVSNFSFQISLTVKGLQSNLNYTAWHTMWLWFTFQLQIQILLPVCYITL